jgi:hypothetical protein
LNKQQAKELFMAPEYEQVREALGVLLVEARIEQISRLLTSEGEEVIRRQGAVIGLDELSVQLFRTAPKRKQRDPQ